MKRMGDNGQKMSNRMSYWGFMRRRNKGRIKGTMNVFKKRCLWEQRKRQLERLEELSNYGGSLTTSEGERKGTKKESAIKASETAAHFCSPGAKFTVRRVSSLPGMGG